MAKLNDKELSRYHRQIILPGFDVSGQEKLKDSRVLVVGAGGLGSPVLMYLVAAGVGTIGIVDFDRVDITNIHRQILYTADDEGKLKSVAASGRLKEVNPDCIINTHNVKLTRYNIMDIIAGYDVVVDGTDNFPTRYLIGDATEIMGIPLVFGAVFQYYGQVSVFNYNEGPSYRCLFPHQPGKGEMLSCSTAGILGPVPGIVGTIQACEAIKIITGIGEPLSGTLLQIDIQDLRTEVIKFSCDPEYKPIELLGEYGDTCDEQVNLISPVDLEKEIREGNQIYIYDIRPSIEYNRFNIGGVNITADELMSLTESLPKEGKVVIVCETGDVSYAIADYLQNNENLPNIYNLEGGIDNWFTIVD